jgi:hypothetical protein
MRRHRVTSRGAGQREFGLRLPDAVEGPPGAVPTADLADAAVVRPGRIRHCRHLGEATSAPPGTIISTMSAGCREGDAFRNLRIPGEPACPQLTLRTRCRTVLRTQPESIRTRSGIALVLQAHPRDEPGPYRRSQYPRKHPKNHGFPKPESGLADEGANLRVRAWQSGLCLDRRLTASFMGSLAIGTGRELPARAPSTSEANVRSAGKGLWSQERIRRPPTQSLRAGRR